MPIEIRNMEIENLEVRTDTAMVSGYAAVFEKKTKPFWGFQEQIRSGAFKSSLENRKRILALWNHDDNQPIGSTDGGQLKLNEDERGLFFELAPIDTTAGRDVKEMIRSGVVKGVSFGFVCKKDEWDETDPQNIVRTLIDVDLIEISPTAFPAYPQTSVNVRSEADIFKEYKAAQERKADENNQKTEAQEQIDVYLAEIQALKEM